MSENLPKEVEEASPKCTWCRGRGRTDCPYCGDSTYDHYCDEKKCEQCGGTGRFMPDALRSAILAALAAARAEAVEECIKACDRVAAGGEVKTIGFIGETHSEDARYIAWELRRLLHAPKQGDNEREMA